MRLFSDVVNKDVSPLVLSRDPKQYLHSTCFFLVPRKHQHYADLRKMIDQHFYSNVTKGNSFVLDGSGRYDLDELEKRKWYVVDLRAEPDEWSNQIVLKDFNKLDDFVAAQVAQQLYDNTKSLVIFADHISQLPKCWKNYSLLGLTAGQTPLELRQICMEATSHTPMDIEVYRGFGDLPATDRSLLLGFSKFNSMPDYVYWPAW